MKKIWSFILCLVISLAMTSVCLASYGEQRENRFLAYQRYADGDRLAYLAKYSKEKALLFIFVFDKQNDLGAFSFQPIGEQQQ